MTVEHGDEFGVALCNGQLGALALRKNEIQCAGQRYLKAVEAFVNTQDVYWLHGALEGLLFCLSSAEAVVRQQLYEHWRTAGLPQYLDLATLERQFGAGQTLTGS